MAAVGFVAVASVCLLSLAVAFVKVVVDIAVVVVDIVVFAAACTHFDPEHQ